MFAKFAVAALGAASVAQAAIIGHPLNARQTPAGGSCNRDNCLRSMVATQFPTRLPQAIADCTSYFWATETPVTVTITSTLTDTATATSYYTSTSISTFMTTAVPLVRRDLASSQLPSYAQTACQGSFSRWSSACSCLGVTSSTSTLATPSTSVSTTETTTTTISSASPTVTLTSFKLRRFTPATPPATGGSNNQYCSVSEDGRLIYTNVSPVPIPQFYLDVNGHLWSGDKVAKGDMTDPSNQVITFAEESASGDPYTCSIANDRMFTCTLGITPKNFAFQNLGGGFYNVVSTTGMTNVIYLKAFA